MLKLRVTIIVDYAVDPAGYPGVSPDEIVLFEGENLDPRDLLLDHPASVIKVEAA